ncbi:MAG: aspartate aminotransferase family protein [Paracoccaceae bacterium]|uniref:aspartate aminotransferase family protein n=1 Tax=Candidatus Salinivivens marinus TaxID=3381703 RepID=UPI000BE04C5B|nr:MAG: aspartate aminotransferase family protein [Rhodobacteraceae bacterium MED-G08]|tara:strand:+ start:2187 stop:3584 length:1398 start_codon:yes stop_codon:yes gene_type:complete
MNIRNHFPTEELQKRDAAHHLHPFTAQHDLANKGSKIITSAQGIYVYDSNGEELLDAMAGLWCVNIGYGREELAQAAERQMRELPYYNTFFQTTHIPAIDLSEKLAKLAPRDLNHVFYAGSGSEANDTNIRIVRQYWALLGHAEKNIIISRKNAYHGSTLGGASLGGMNAMHQQGGLPIPNVQHINQPDWWAEGGELSPEEFGLARARELEEAIVEYGEERVAAFIAEPVQGAGGVIVAPDTYWPEIQRICDKYEIILIADEVICGFGRTGNWFGSQTMKIRPDIMTVAKGLSSGYQPIGGSIVSKKIAEVIGKDEFNHGYTYSSHPVAAAVALANLNIIESEGIVERVKNQTGPYLANKWATLSDHPMVGEAKIVGMMGSLALTPDKANRAKFLSPSGTVGYICRECCFANNLIMRHVGDRMIISPPLIIDKEQIDILIERAWKSLDEGMSKVKVKGLWKSAPI